MAEEWFLTSKGKGFGPFSPAQLKQMVEAGLADPDDLVWQHGDSESIPVSAIGMPPLAEDQMVSRHVPPPPRLPSVVANSPASAAPASGAVSPELDLLATDMTIENPSVPLPPLITSNLFNRLLPYWAVAWQRLRDFGKQATKAGQLGKLYTLRKQLQQLKIPKMFAALGTHVHAERLFADELSILFAKIDEAVSQQSALVALNDSNEKQEDIASKLKGVTDGLLRHSKRTAIVVKLWLLMSKLGEAAYQKHGQNSGPAQLIAPVEAAHEELQQLQQQIDSLESASSERVLTPKRLLVGSVVVACILMLLALISVSSKAARLDVSQENSGSTKQDESGSNAVRLDVSQENSGSTNQDESGSKAARLDVSQEKSRSTRQEETGGNAEQTRLNISQQFIDGLPTSIDSESFQGKRVTIVGLWSSMTQAHDSDGKATEQKEMLLVTEYKGLYAVCRFEPKNGAVAGKASTDHSQFTVSGTLVGRRHSSVKDMITFILDDCVIDDMKKRGEETIERFSKKLKPSQSKAETFMEQLAVLRGLSKDSPLPPRQFDNHGAYFHDPRYYYKMNDEVDYDEWVEAFGEPFDVRLSTHEFHEWQQHFRGHVVHVAGVLKTPIHHEQTKKYHENTSRYANRQRPLNEYEDTKWKVVVFGVSVD